MSTATSRTPRAPRLSVDLTEEIINDSKERDSSHCMIAEAVRVAYPDAAKVSVDIQTIRFSDPKKGLRFVYLTPRVAQVAIVRFDQGLLPPPFKFRLRGGQVTVAGRRPDTRPQSEKQQVQRTAAAAAAREELKKARLVHRQVLRGDDPEGKPYGMFVPDRIGGRTPPADIGRRREFGIRAFDRIQ